LGDHNCKIDAIMRRCGVLVHRRPARGYPQIRVRGCASGGSPSILLGVSEHLRRYRDLSIAYPRGRIRRALEAHRLARLGRGVYRGRAAIPREPLEYLRALFMRLPAGVVLGHESGARLFGVALPHRGDGAVHVLVPAGLARPRISGVVCHEAVLEVPEPVWVYGVPCAPAARCVIDLVRARKRLDGIAILDAALRAGVCDRSTLLDEVLLHGGLRHVCRARDLVPLADGRAECAQESHLRLVVVDGGLPRPEPQFWVPDATGRSAYRLDLAYREQRVGLEYDGRSHLDSGRLAADRSRMNWLAGRGWKMRYFTARDIYRTPALVIATVRAALGPS
jgi:hypothetical protein